MRRLVSGTLEELLRVDFGPPLHSLVLVGELHFIERDMFDFWHWDREHRATLRAQEKADEELRQREQWERDSRERRAQDEQRKRQLLQRKDEQRQRRDLEAQQQRSQQAAAHTADDADDGDGVNIEPLF